MRATIRNIQEFLPEEYKVIWAKDGFNVSVDASKYHYCSPKDSHGPWNKVEVKYPFKPYLPLRLYADDKKNLTATVYRYVPLDIVCNMLNEHGGIDVEKTRNNIIR